MTSYNLHDLLHIRITELNQNLKLNYDHFLRRFQVPHCHSVPEYEILRYDQFQLPSEFSIVNNRYFGFVNGISFPVEKYAITYDGRTLTEYTDSANRATNLFIQFLLVQKELSFIHCAAVELNGKGIVFPAFGGAGKTIAVSALKGDAGFKFYGDDYVIVDNRGYMHAYPCDLSIYKYHLDLFPELEGSLYEKYLFRFEKYQQLEGLLLKSRLLFPLSDLFHLLYPKPLAVNASAGWSLNYIKVPVSEVIDSSRIGTRTKVTASVLLERHNHDCLVLENIGLTDFVNELTGILSFEFKDCFHYLNLLSYFSGTNLLEISSKQRRILSDCFADVKCYKLKVPYNMEPSELGEKLLTSIEGIF